MNGAVIYLSIVIQFCSWTGMHSTTEVVMEARLFLRSAACVIDAEGSV